MTSNIPRQARGEAPVRPGVYDESYLNEVAERISWYRNNGVRVILDMHYVDAVRERARDVGASWTCWSNDPGPWAPRDERGNWTPLADHLDRQ